MRYSFIFLVRSLIIISLSIGCAACMQAQSDPVPEKMSFRLRKAPVGAEIGSDEMIERLKLDPSSQLPPAFLARPAGSEFTITLWLRIDSAGLLAATVWDDKTPMTVFSFASDDKSERLIMRLLNGRVTTSATSDGGKTWPAFNPPAKLGAGRWTFVAYVQSGATARLYLDGALVGVSPTVPTLGKLEHLIFGRLGQTRHLSGMIVQPRVFARALTAREVQQRADTLPIGVERGGGGPNTPTAQAESATFGRYPVLQVLPVDLHPLIDQLHYSATVVSWRGAQAKDLLVAGLHAQYFGGRVGYFRQLGVDHRGLPLYDTGTTLPGLEAREFLAANEGREIFAMQTLDNKGARSLVRYAPQITTASADLGHARPVLIDGRSFTDVFGSAIGGWFVGYVDNDDVLDLLVAPTKTGTTVNVYWPDGEGMWSQAERANSGPGKGYDINGNWLGGECISELYWCKGRTTKEGQLEFTDKKIVHYRRMGFSVQWKSGERERALATVRLGDRMYLLHTGSVDQVRAMGMRCEGGELICEESVPLLADGAAVRETYFMHSISELSRDSAGKVRLLLDGNPGRLVVLEGDRPGAFRELGGIFMRGGPVAADTLSTPVRMDWDGDGLPDLIIGDASGWLTWWRGTEDPKFYHAGVAFMSDGRPVHHQAGYSGSIQGPNERRWGYLQPTAGDWDGDGRPDLITNDIHGVITLYRPGSKTSELSIPEEFTFKQQTYRVAWRSRPAILDRTHGYGAEGRASLLHLDWDGDLAVAIPEAEGSTVIQRVNKLRYESGEVIRLCGPAGFWGRAELSVADWNGDGRWDVVFGTARSTHRNFLKEKPSGATPMWLENVGSNERPVFRMARAIKLRSGEYIDLGVHTASVWPTDLDQDQALDLIIGAEDGKVYYFNRTTLE